MAMCVMAVVGVAPCQCFSLGREPDHVTAAKFASDSNWCDLILFYEYFHGDTGQGLGASHQTGWTAPILP